MDNSQHFFAEPVSGVDTLCTCRKYFGVTDGGYLYTDARLSQEMEKDVSYERMEFVLGRYECDASKFYEKASSNNKIFENEDLKEMSLLTQNLLKGIDYDFVIKRRIKNFEYLHNALGKTNKLELTVPIGAFMYPLYIENGMQIKKKLASDKIYIPTLWPDVLENCKQGSIEDDYAQNILPLPVDQRYGTEEMKKIKEAILKCIS